MRIKKNGIFLNIRTFSWYVKYNMYNNVLKLKNSKKKQNKSIK